MESSGWFCAMGKVQPVLLADPARLVLDVEGAVVDALDDELYIDQGLFTGFASVNIGGTASEVDLAKLRAIRSKMPMAGFSVVFNQRVGRVNRCSAQIRLQLACPAGEYSVKRLQNPTG